MVNGASLLTSLQGVAYVAQQALLLALLAVALLLCLLGLGLLLVGPLFLPGFLCSSSLPLLGLAFCLLALVVSDGASGFLHLALGLLLCHAFLPPLVAWLIN